MAEVLWVSTPPPIPNTGWPWYGELIGARFDNHPPSIKNTDVISKNSNHPATSMLPETWNRDDEW